MAQTTTTTTTTAATTTTKNHQLMNFFSTDDEFEVIQILLQVQNLISKSEPLNRFSFSWGSKKQRSRFSQVKLQSSSPETPLSFSHSESDFKFKHSKPKISKKRKRDELMLLTTELTRNNELLKDKIETVKLNHNKLKAHNLQLKAKKDELCLCLEKETAPKIGVELAKPEAEQQFANHTLLIVDHTTYSFGGYSSSSGLGINNNNNYYNHVGPLGIPDLNLTVEDVDSIQMFDLRKVIAAHARKRRLEINRVKNPLFLNKARSR